jgi:3-hydroxypropanoate dehydrogenase
MEADAFSRQHMLDLLFLEAKTHYGWTDRPVSGETVRALYELAKLPPTASNGMPGRFVFIRSSEAKERLRPALSRGNVDKTMQAPCTVIVAWDSRWHEHLPRLFPAWDMRSVYEGKEELIRETALRNSSLQGAYLILAARALGLDCGPMSGFDNKAVDAEFFADGRWKSNFLCNLGYGDRSQTKPRAPRLSFEEACLDL